MNGMSHSNSTAQPHTQGENEHATLRALLPEYATIMAVGGPAAEAFPQVGAHVATCAGCRAALAELVELTRAAYGGDVEASAMPPHPDLTFLPPSTRRPTPG